MQIFDVLHAHRTGGEVRRFSGFEELSVYAAREGKMFPLKEIRLGPLKELVLGIMKAKKKRAREAKAAEMEAEEEGGDALS